MRKHLKTKVCIVGLGPSGLGAAIVLSKSSLGSKVICLDAGNLAENRNCSALQNKDCRREKPCELISGFGGCSLSGGGKISDFPAGTNLAKIIGSAEEAKGKLRESIILIKKYITIKKPRIALKHIKNAKRFFTNLGFQYKYYSAFSFDQKGVRKTYQKLFLELKNSGISFLMESELVKIQKKGGRFELKIKRNNRIITIMTDYLIVGVGRLGRDLLKKHNKKLNLGGENNNLDIGVRLKFPSRFCPNISKYHNDLKLLFKDARTFCVCKNGRVSAYSLNDIFLTEGSSNPVKKSSFTNLAILVRRKPSIVNNVLFSSIRKRMINITNGRPICQNLLDFLGINHKSKYTNVTKDDSCLFINQNLHTIFPEQIYQRIKKAVYYFVSKLVPSQYWSKITVFGPEIDYNGLKFPVKSDFSITPKMYLIGDCTGRFRGILQSFCSGIICAEDILNSKNERTK